MKNLSAGALAALFCLSAFGCGQANQSHLPKPRPPEPEAPSAASSGRAKPAPAAAPAPVAARQSASPAASPPLAPAASPPSAATGGNFATSPAPLASRAELSEADRRRLVISQLTRIGQALEAYRAKKAGYPARSAFAGQLSWRVALLPYLGYADLYGMFDKEERWDHPSNRQLLGRIPDVFKSADRSDGKTNLVLIAGPETAYETAAGLRAELCLDGLENTLLVVEVDDAHAVPWTAADDYQFQRETLQTAFFGKHTDCCYALFGGATGARRIPATVADDNLLALITPAGGEAVSIQDLTSAPRPDVDTPLIQELREHPLVRFTQREVPAPETTPSGAESTDLPPRPDVAGTSVLDVADQTTGGGNPSANLSAKIAPVDQRAPVPDDAALQRAATLVRDVYGREYEAAKKPEQRRALAKKMLAEARTLATDPAGLFVVYRSAREIAAQTGDLDTSLSANRALTETFRVNPLPAERRIVEQVAAEAQTEQEWKLLCDQALRVGDQTLGEDDFAGAQRLYSLALSAARRAECRDRLTRVYQKQELWKGTQLAYHRVSRQIHVLLRTPDEPAANAAVGRYLALVKRDWERGLAMLARGDDATLSQLAQRELRPAATPAEQLQLADDWWDWAEQFGGSLERGSARQHAAEGYRRLLPQLPPSLVTARLEARLDEVSQSDNDPSLAAAEKPNG